MAATSTPALPTPHFRDRFIIDGPEKPTHLQNYQRATKYILHRWRKGSMERKIRRAMEKGGMTYDKHAPTDTIMEPVHAVATQTEATYQASKKYRRDVAQYPKDPTLHCTIGPDCLWDVPRGVLRGVSPNWAVADEQGELNCTPKARRWGYPDDPEYEMDLPPNETLEEATQVQSSQTEPAPASTEAKEAQASGKKGRSLSLASIISSFVRKRLSHSDHH